MEVLMHEASLTPRSLPRSVHNLILSSKELNGTASSNNSCCDCHHIQKSKKDELSIAGSNIVPNNYSSPLLSTTYEHTMDIIFENISFTVNQGFRKGRKEILHGINGRLESRQLIAIMGPSGAGKSTLLDILSGYRITGVDGNISINGRLRNLDSFRKSSAYITQDDRLQPLLTVIENMRVAADLKLSIETKRHEKEAIIEEILTTLGLYEHLYTRASRLSGGQKKRLSIALELVNNPTVMFLDEPTTGLDSSSCTQVVNLMKVLARQGRTIVCTIHQPSASLFQLFDQVYVLSSGLCLYQGTTQNLIPFLESVKLPCPMYHNPADYVIEIACGEHGEDKINTMVQGTENGRNLQWFEFPDNLLDAKGLRAIHPLRNSYLAKKTTTHQATSQLHQLYILLKRGFLKAKRDSTNTHLRILVNVFTGIMLGSLFIHAGNDGDRAIENYNLLFSCLMHHMMTTMMLTVLTFPMEMSILQKEHFNRWYSLKSFYLAVNIVDIPLSVFCCSLFSIIIYLMSAQPLEYERFSMFFAISLLVALVAQSVGLMIGACCDVVNGTFLAPTISVPMMMFAGFGVRLSDMPDYLKWGSYVSYLRYGLEGYVDAIYGLDRPNLGCSAETFGIRYCHYKYPKKFITDIVGMSTGEFWNDIMALSIALVLLRIGALLCLRWKLMSSR